MRDAPTLQHGALSSGHHGRPCRRDQLHPAASAGTAPAQRCLWSPRPLVELSLIAVSKMQAADASVRLDSIGLVCKPIRMRLLAQHIQHMTADESKELRRNANIQSRTTTHGNARLPRPGISLCSISATKVSAMSARECSSSARAISRADTLSSAEATRCRQVCPCSI